MISIIDYGAGNLNSVKKAIQFLGYPCETTRDADQILTSDRVILPGVGAFEDAMKNLRKSGLDRVVCQVVEKQIPILGVCLGMQLFYEQSEEGDNPLGLGILKGRIKRFPDGMGLKIPQMGWNSLAVKKTEGIFRGLSDPYVYFVHSFYLDAEQKSEVAATCDYGVTFDAAVETGRIHLTQFHPEKSGEAGLNMLRNFIEESNDDREMGEKR